MTADLIFSALFLMGLSLMRIVLGAWRARVFSAHLRLLTPIERALYRTAGISPAGGGWKAYAASVLIVNAARFVLLYLILCLQGFLPFNLHGCGIMEGRRSMKPSAS